MEISSTMLSKDQSKTGEKKGKKKTIFLCGVVLFSLLIFTGCSASSADTGSSEVITPTVTVSPEQAAAAAKAESERLAEVAAQEEAERKAAEKAAAEKAAADKIGYNTGITYKQLARTPDKYKDKKVKFTGTVIQVMDGDTETQLRIAVNDNYDTILLVAYNNEITSMRVLEDDNVTIRGVSQGVYTYESTNSGNITIPLVFVDKIKINE